jgi:hypothetical protein
MKKLMFITCLSSLLLFSCDFSDSGDDQTGNFWAQDMVKGSYYRVDAELLYTGTYCTVWVEKGSGVTWADAQQIANEYDSNIYQKMIDAFGLTNLTFYNYGSFSNTMKFADWLGRDRDGKLCILLLDIKDYYKIGVNESYVAGYFWGGDLQDVRYSNLRDMIYIDTNPGLSSYERRKNAYRTLAHEMQHLMNFVTSFVKRSTQSGNTLNVSLMDVWIDEGLASAAEFVYGGHSTDRISWFKNNGGDYNSLINRGNNFFVWGNRESESVYANQDDYSTVYLFFQWLRLQANTTGIYKDIIASTSSNQLAVVNAITGYSNWETLLKEWLAANYINASSGAYGYKGDPAFAGMRAPIAPSGTTSLNLYPGEGVYSITNSNPALSGQGANIKNTFLSTTGLNDSVFSNGGALLTYNINTNARGGGERGVTTGVAANQIMRTSSGVQVSFSGPFIIDARDLRMRGGGHEGSIVEFPLPININAGE